jgi:hypothetical protein
MFRYFGGTSQFRGTQVEKHCTRPWLQALKPCVLYFYDPTQISLSIISLQSQMKINITFKLTTTYKTEMNNKTVV